MKKEFMKKIEKEFAIRGKDLELYMKKADRVYDLLCDMGIHEYEEFVFAVNDIEDEYYVDHIEFGEIVKKIHSQLVIREDAYRGCWVIYF